MAWSRACATANRWVSLWFTKMLYPRLAKNCSVTSSAKSLRMRSTGTIRSMPPAIIAARWRRKQIVDATIASFAKRRRWAQKIGALALVPFVGFLAAHGINHNVPLFLASFAGFLVALVGIWNIPKMRALALREARHEFAEYYFLFPLFLSITLLTKAGFFDVLQGAHS